MACATAAISPNDPQLNRSQSVFEHAPLATAYQRYLDSIGLHRKAQRLADIGNQFNWYNAAETMLDASDRWRQAPFTPMLRTDPYFATRAARIQQTQYAAFGELIGDWFTRIDFSFYSPKSTIFDEPHFEDQRTVRAIRRVIGEFLHRSIDKLGGAADLRWNRKVKVLFAGTLPAALFFQIQSALPEGVFVRYHRHRKIDFPEELASWAHADLPLDEMARADMELFLNGLQQTAAHKVPREIERQFALEHKTPNANLPITPSDIDSMLLPNPTQKRPRYVPRSPKTGKPARFVSVPVDRNTRPEDIPPEDWIEIPQEG